jgi:transposase-like protein
VQACVELSSDPLIEYLDFCRAIAEAVCPTGEKRLEGIECVTGKIWIGHVPIPESAFALGQPPQGWQSVLLSEDGRTLNDLLPSSDLAMSKEHVAELPLGTVSHRPMIGELSLPFLISEAERSVLAELLLNLPPLRYPMSEEERAAFMEAYCNLPNHPMWIPDLVTDATIQQRKMKQDNVLASHRQALRQEIEAGRLNPVDRDHTRVANLMAGTFIPRSQAISYLERHGLAYDDAATGRLGSDVALVCDVAPQKSEASELPTDKKKAIGKSLYSFEDKRTAVDLYQSLKAGKAKNFAQQVAVKYGVTVKTIDNWVKKVEREKNATLYSSTIVHRRK